ncbi:hypothetical protein GE21DRAFT_1307593 [Neurospora crassa]|nr:hypothetical protein GE21DRAFT_1307593 [Neurospora crassa]
MHDNLVISQEATGTSAIDYFLLYPADDDWDAHSCQVVFGSVAIHNPYLSQIAQILIFHGVSFTG